MHGFLDFQLETCGSRGETSEERKRQFSELFTCLKMWNSILDRGEMFADASGEVSVGFTNITGNTAYT